MRNCSAFSRSILPANQGQSSTNTEVIVEERERERENNKI